MRNATPSAPIGCSGIIRRTPGLQFKKLEGEDDIYSARIGLGYRASVLDRQSRPIQPLGLIVGAARPGDPVNKMEPIGVVIRTNGVSLVYLGVW